MINKKGRVKALETGIILLENQVAADFFDYYCRIVKKSLGRSWDFFVINYHFERFTYEYICVTKAFGFASDFVVRWGVYFFGTALFITIFFLNA